MRMDRVTQWPAIVGVNLAQRSEHSLFLARLLEEFEDSSSESDETMVLPSTEQSPRRLFALD